MKENKSIFGIAIIYSLNNFVLHKMNTFLFKCFHPLFYLILISSLQKHYGKYFNFYFTEWEMVSVMLMMGKVNSQTSSLVRLLLEQADHT